MEFNPELIIKAKQCETAEELITLAKENDMELTAEEAKAYFEQFNQESGEIADSELENVAGGACHKKDGRKIITVLGDCEGWRCINHGTGYENVPSSYSHGTYRKCKTEGCEIATYCKNCKYMSYEKGLWLCNNKDNMK